MSGLLRRFVSVGGPGALFAFGAVSMRTDIQSDPGVESLYGFPWPWHMASLVSSLEHDIDPAMLAADLAVYLAIGLALCSVRAWKPPLELTVVAWCFAAFSIAWLSLPFMFGTSFGPLLDGPTLERAVHFGP